MSQAVVGHSSAPLAQLVLPFVQPHIPVFTTTVNPPASVAELLPVELAARLDTVDVISRKMLAGRLQGERRGKRRGRSVEFDDYREYVPGDDLRHIDWNVLARLDKFFIKLFQEEEDLSLDLLIDCSPSMHAGEPTKLLFAARLACALGYLGLVHNNRVSVTCFGNTWPGSTAINTNTATNTATDAQPSSRLTLKRLEPLRGRRNTQRLVQFILDQAFLPPAGVSAIAADVGLDKAIRAAVSRPSGAKGVLILISDMLVPPVDKTPGYDAALRTLGAACGGSIGRGGATVDAYIIQTLAPTELDPAGENASGANTAAPGRTRAAQLLGDVRLTDAETGRAAELTITPRLIATYRQALTRYNQQLSAACAARGIGFVSVPTDVEIASLVLGLLRRRGIVG